MGVLYVRRNLLIYEVESWITGVCSPHVVCLFLHVMWLCKSQQLLGILPFSKLCLSAIRIIIMKILWAMYMMVGIVV